VLIARRTLLIGLGGGLLSPRLSLSKQQPKISRIGFLGATSASGLGKRLEAFRTGLRELDYAEGKNLVIEYRWADGKYERLPELAAELVRSKVEVIVTYGTPGTLAAKRATTTIPIVMIVSGDAIATGLIASLARPGVNITGSTFFVSELMAKRLELLKEALPRLAKVGVLLNPDNSVNPAVLKAMASTAGSLNMELHSFAAREPREFEDVFSAMANRDIDAIVLFEDGMMITNAKAIADIAARHQLPSSGPKEFVELGSLIGYGVKILELWRRGPYFVDRILKGAKPRELPVEQATKFELAVNLNTAKRLGITISPSVLVRVDDVIN
jgi:putative ABC transport system substrate-binding protein